ncbi:hypothetical protein AB0M43_01655 [Longispora sp. NPDC051575]|uniref:hypothetical protein n=1 Tax=Longispora sp. NPDC051575 TaxID=3154943 RepID=UPI003423E3EB
MVTVWIGGGTGSGKTTLTRILAGRHGLRVFPLDAFWHSHEARLPEPERSPDDQWLGLTPVEQAAEFEALARKRWPLVLADLAALPASPPVVVEGPQVLPDLVPDGDAAVFLVSTAPFQRSVLERRPLPPTADAHRALENRIEKDRRYGERVAALAAARGFPVVTVDGTLPVEEILAAVEGVLPGIVGLDVEPADLRAARRWENGVVADNIRTWLGTAHVPPVAPTGYPFACECGARGCDAQVVLPLASYEAATRLVAPGH